MAASAALTYVKPEYRRYVEEEGGTFISFLYTAPFFHELLERIAAENPDASEDEVQALYYKWMQAPPNGEGKRMQQAVAERSAEYHASFLEERRVDIRNARTELADAALDTTGFTLVEHTPSMPLAELPGMEGATAAAYREEVMELVKEMTGALHAFCNEQAVRKEPEPGEGNALSGVGDEPVYFVHNDFTDCYKDDVLAAFEGTGGTYTFGALEQMKAAGMTLESLRQSRILVVNTWRNIGSEQPLRRKPLALLDMRTIREEDMFGERLGGADAPDALETANAVHSDRHQWSVTPLSNRA
jgi:hypothetical protein